MKKLEEYINEYEQIDESLLDLFKGLFSSNGLKAASTSIQQSIENSIAKKYPNFMKAFNELQKSDAEDKKLIENFNKIYKAIDGMKLNDNQKVFQKLCQLSMELGRFGDKQKDKKDDTNQDENTTKLDKEKHKAYFDDLTKKMEELHKQHEEICKKYDEAVKKGEVKEEDVLSNSEGGDKPTQSEETVDTATNNVKDAITSAGGNPDTVIAAVKKFLGLQTESKIELPNILGIEGYITEGDKSEEAKKYFAADQDKDGKRLQALTALLGAWQGLAKQLPVDSCQKIMPLIQAIISNAKIIKELDKK